MAKAAEDAAPDTTAVAAPTSAAAAEDVTTTAETTSPPAAPQDSAPAPAEGESTADEAAPGADDASSDTVAASGTATAGGFLQKVKGWTRSMTESLGQNAEDVAKKRAEKAERKQVAAREAEARTKAAASTASADTAGNALVVRGLTKSFGDFTAVDGIDLTVPAGGFYGIVGPNGAGKTTTLSMVAGLLRPDAGAITVCGIDLADDPEAAKKVLGVLPDRLRTFDRLTGRQLLHYYGLLRGLAPALVEARTIDLARAFDLTGVLGRVVSDYSAGMTKKIMLAGALIHSPRLLVLDEPFESVDPDSSAVILDILRAYVDHGGTVILSSHGMELVEQVCERVAIIVGGSVPAEGSIDEVRAGQTLAQRFVELSGGAAEVEGLEWLHAFSD